MATGDIKNNLRKLKNELKLIQYTNEVDFEKMLIGLSAPFLPILHFVFNDFSHELTSYFSKKGHDLYAKSDFRFLEIIYKILITEFETKPMLTKQQFFSIGFPEIKVIFTTKIVSLCREKHNSMVKKSGKTKKKIRKSSQSQHDQTKKDDTQRTDSLLSTEVNTVEVIADDSVCILPQNLSQTGHQAMLPKPIPELALSPVKADARQQRGCSTDIRMDDTEGVDGIDSQLLDLTDVGEDSFIETGGIELIDEVEETCAMLPEFKIMKHSPRRDNVKVTTNYLPILRDLTTGGNHVHTEMLSGHSLPSNIPLPTSKQTSQGVESCNQCIVNLRMMETLQQKVESMEKDILNLVSVNNDLSAKVVLMETKLKIMDSGRNENAKIQNIDEHPTQSDVDFHGNIDQNVEDDEEPSDSFPASEHVTAMTSKITDDVKAVTEEKSYSPIKYTDDDIIIKDFKPIRMKDVYSMMNEVRIDEDKENDNSIPRKPTNIKTRKEPLALKIVMDTDESDNMLSTSDDVDDLFTDSCNVSRLDDTIAEEAVCNVKKRLQKTKEMLRKSGNYI